MMGVLHLEHSPVAVLDHAGYGHPVAFVQLSGDKRLVEPGDPNAGSAVVTDYRLRESHFPKSRGLGGDRQDRADHGRLSPRRERSDRDRIAVGLPPKWQREEQVANGFNSKLAQCFCLDRADVG